MSDDDISQISGCVKVLLYINLAKIEDPEICNSIAEYYNLKVDYKNIPKYIKSVLSELNDKDSEIFILKLFILIIVEYRIVFL